MRYLAHQRRRLVSVVLLLILFLSFYLWIEENFKLFIEKKLEQLLNCDVKIGNVKGGILSNLVLVNLTLLSPYPPFNFLGFEAKRVQFNFRLWDIFFTNITFKNILPLVITEAKLSLIRPIVSELSAQITEDWFHGDFYLFGNTKMEFAGDMAISKGGLEIGGVSVWKALLDESLPPQKERIDIKGRIDSSNSLIDVKLNHFQIKDIDLSTDIKIKNRIDKGFVKGELTTSNSIVDFEPVKEVKADYEFSASVFRIIILEWAKGIKLSGIVKLTEPHYIDLLLEISNVNLEDLAFLAGLKEKEKEKVSGLVDGRFSLRGFWPSPYIKTTLVSKNGNLSDVDYDLVKLNLKGKSPLIKIVNSWIKKEERYTLLEGEVDLRKIGSREMFKDLEVIFDEDRMVWGGWDITRDSEPELELGKDVGENFRVSFKTFMNDELLNEDTKGNEFGLDYKLSEDETLKMRLKESEEFLGIERKLKF